MKSIAVIFNTIETVEYGLDQDKIADNEIQETVHLVCEALKSQYQIEPLQANHEALAKLCANEFDFVFNLCEGFGNNRAGEASFAGFLELLQIPFTGASSLCLHLATDKKLTKKILESEKIPTPAAVTIESMAAINRHALPPFPLIIKPIHEDASIGISNESIVHSHAELKKQVEYIIKRYHQPALAEAYITGREINVAIIGNASNLEVLPISEIRFLNPDLPQIVSYEAKWMERSPMYQHTQGCCPAILTAVEQKNIITHAKHAYQALGCRDYARVDIRLQNNIPYVIDINPNPGINSDSGFFRSARIANLSYAEMILKILNTAQARHKQ